LKELQKEWNASGIDRLHALAQSWQGSDVMPPDGSPAV